MEHYSASHTHKDLEWNNKGTYLALFLTLSRALAVIIYGICAIGNRPEQIAWLFPAIMFTTAVDGWVARKFKADSEQGGMLDGLCSAIGGFSLFGIMTVFYIAHQQWAVLTAWVALNIITRGLVIPGIILNEKPNSPEPRTFPQMQKDVYNKVAGQSIMFYMGTLAEIAVASFLLINHAPELTKIYIVALAVICFFHREKLLTGNVQHADLNLLFDVGQKSPWAILYHVGYWYVMK